MSRICPLLRQTLVYKADSAKNYLESVVGLLKLRNVSRVVRDASVCYPCRATWMCGGAHQDICGRKARHEQSSKFPGRFLPSVPMHQPMDRTRVYPAQDDAFSEVAITCEYARASRAGVCHPLGPDGPPLTSAAVAPPAIISIAI